MAQPHANLRMTALDMDPLEGGSGLAVDPGVGMSADQSRADPAVVIASELAVEAAAAAEKELAAAAATGGPAPHDAGLVAIQPAPARDQRTRRGPPRPLRFVGGFLFGLLGIFAISAGGLYAFDLQFSGRILPGVHVGAVDLSGLTQAQASARLAEAYASLSDGELVLVAGERQTRTSLQQLGRRADVEAMVADAVAAGRIDAGLDRLVLNARTATQGIVLEPRVVINSTALAEAVAAFTTTASVAPVDGRVTTGGGTYTVIPATVGITIDATALLADATDAIRALEIPSSVTVPAHAAAVQPVVTTEEASAAADLAKRVEADLVLADILQSWTIPAVQIHGWISFQVTGGGGYVPVATPKGLDDQLAAWAVAIQRPPSNASYLFDKGGTIVGASEGQDGRRLDGGGTIAAIAAVLAQRAGGATVTSVAPAVTLVQPELTTRQAADTAPLMSKIGEWTTYFPIYVNNGFGANIWIPAMDINGYVVTPGSWFDFWKAIGPVTRERGYMDGGAIINGHTEPQGALAGGICSASTTLFNAALRAGLQMGSRHNHYYYIGRYPLGLDATVWQSSGGSIQSMTFRNDTDYPILIRAYKIQNGSSGYVKFEIYGVPTGRTVSIGASIVKNPTKAVDTIEYTDTLPAGTTKRIETPTDGMDVWVTVTVTDANGNVIHETTYYSHYARIDGITLMGTS